MQLTRNGIHSIKQPRFPGPPAPLSALVVALTLLLVSTLPAAAYFIEVSGQGNAAAPNPGDPNGPMVLPPTGPFSFFDHEVSQTTLFGQGGAGATGYYITFDDDNNAEYIGISTSSAVSAGGVVGSISVFAHGTGDAAGGTAGGLGEAKFQDFIQVTSATLPVGTLVTLTALPSLSGNATADSPDGAQCSSGFSCALRLSAVGGYPFPTTSLQYGQTLDAGGALISTGPGDNSFLVAIGQTIEVDADAIAQFTANSGGALASAGISVQFKTPSEDIVGTSDSGLTYFTHLAADRYYVGPNGGLWSSPANWSATSGGPGGASVPTDSDFAVVNSSLSVTFDGNYSGAGLATLNLNGAGGPATVSQSSNTMTTALLNLGRDLNTSGTYSLSGGTLNLTNSSFYGPLLIGVDGTGALNLSQSAVVNSIGNAVAGLGLDNPDSGTINQTGGSFTIGTPVSFAALTLGYYPGATGAYHMDATTGASTLTVYGDVYIGLQGDGTFTQDGGTVTINTVSGNQNTGFMSIAASPGTSSYTINGGTLISTNSYGIQVGGYPGNPGGTGTLTINGGTVNGANPTVLNHSGITVYSNGTVNLNGGTLNGSVFSQGVVNQNAGQFNLLGTIGGTGVINLNGGATTFADGAAIDISDVAISNGVATAAGSLLVGKGTSAVGILNLRAGSLTVTNGTFGVGNTGTLTNGAGTGQVNISGGRLEAVTVILGSTTGGSGNMTVSGTGQVTVTGGLSRNDLTVNGGTVQVIAGPPPPGEDPVLNNAMVGGYLRDGAMTVNAGTVSAPIVKLGVTTGNTGTVTINGGTVTAGVFGVGNDGTLTNGTGIGHAVITNGTLNASTVLLGSSVGGSGDMTVSGTGQVTVTGGLQWNDLTVNGGTVQVIAGPPPPGEDPVLNNAMVGGYLRDGGMTITGGTASTPLMKLGVSSGFTGTLTVSGGVTSVQTNLWAGYGAGATGVVFMTAGTLAVTNSGRTAALVLGYLGNGKFTLNGGSVQADQLQAINDPNSRFIFNRGIVSAYSVSISNNQPLVVGDGTSPATLQLTGGTNNFSSMLVVSSNAVLTGNGTINGPVVNYGTIIAGQPGDLLTFNSAVTNYGALVMTNGGTLVFNGPVVTYARPVITGVSRSGSSVTVTLNSIGGLQHALEYKQHLDDVSWTATGASAEGTGGSLSLMDNAATTQTRFYHVRVGQ